MFVNDVWSDPPFGSHDLQIFEPVKNQTYTVHTSKVFSISVFQEQQYAPTHGAFIRYKQ